MLGIRPDFVREGALRLAFWAGYLGGLVRQVTLPLVQRFPWGH